ncbi:MAG: class I SAM-dependent methyltransferase [Candidatus Omnitrophica bacterium]|nr:class I SAM-dependent methyltransferase [Candidatus Omnitrophota bacterium]
MKLFGDLYNENYVQAQLNKFHNRKLNHWAPRIAKVFDLVSQLDLRGSGEQVLDLGTSIGTYAYEFAVRGYNVTGIDLDEKSISIARKIAEGDGKNINYIVGDVSDRSNFKDNEFDLIYAGDIIEHLENDLLLKTMSNCFSWLKPGGFFVFHTVPTKYDLIFHKSFLWICLVPFCLLPDRLFKKFTGILYRVLNLGLKIFTGKSWQDREKQSVHCNLQTKESLFDILIREGFKVKSIELAIIEERFRQEFKMFLFGRREYFQKDIFGVAVREDEPEKCI